MLLVFGTLFGLGFAGITTLALISLYGNRHNPSMHRYDDDWPDDEPADLFLVVANSWLDRNGWIIGRFVLFCIGLRILLTCTQP